MAVMTRRTVREIPRAMILNIDTTEITKLVVVAYARVSTEKEEQEDSFERQVSHYTALITSKLEWEFGGIYADPGITGTKAEKRPDFMRMIADCRAGKINKVLVKSISRFARNTVDALKYIRELKELGPVVDTYQAYVRAEQDLLLRKMGLVVETDAVETFDDAAAGIALDPGIVAEDARNGGTGELKLPRNVCLRDFLHRSSSCFRRRIPPCCKLY